MLKVRDKEDQATVDETVDEGEADEDLEFFIKITKLATTEEMSDGFEFCVKEDGLVAEMSELRRRNLAAYENRTLTDFTVVCKTSRGNQLKIPCHKSVLAKGSTIFAGLFECENCKAEITIKDCESEVVEEFIKFLYVHEIDKQVNT